jgi:AcrR family transcriptional regulator
LEVFLPDDTAMRHIPQQTRSQQRVDLILEVASVLFSEVGYGAVTTNAIAERAGISIGSLYRYFPDKEAIMRALTKRYFDRMRELYDEVFTPDAVYLPLRVLLDRLIDPFVELHYAYPGFKAILFGADVSDDIAAAAAELEEMTLKRIEDFVRISAPHLEEERVRIVALLCKASVKSVLSLLEQSSDEKTREQVISEVKRMLQSYLEPILEKRP